MSETKVDIWMPLFVGDYLKEAARLSTEQHGAYLLLLMAYWTDGPLSDDDRELSAIARLSMRVWRGMREKIARFFEVGDGRWRHPRLDAEIANWTRRKAMAVERGRRAGLASAKATSSRLGVRLEVDPSPSPGEEEAKSASSLSGRRSLAGRADGPPAPAAWSGPLELRSAIAAEMGEDYARAWLGGTAWREEPAAIVCRLSLTAQRLERDLSGLLAARGVAVIVGGEGA